MSRFKPIPIIDVFAGPGGLGEGFSSFGGLNPRFNICLSIEKEKTAHQTLQLRAFYRKFPTGSAPAAYYAFLKHQITTDDLFNQFPSQAELACREAQCAELGVTDHSLIDSCIDQSLNKKKTWVLIGGPPCQAYSLVGRSRNRGIENYKAETDQRHFLYLEYLRIITEHCPPLFIMENVKGLLSSRVNGTNIFARIIDDLQAPYKIKHQSDTRKCFNYNIYSLVTSGTTGLFNDSTYNPGHFIVKSESYGIPQARHRVILLGIRQDYNGLKPKPLTSDSPVAALRVLKDLPRIRSGLSRNDTPEAWCSNIKQILKSSWLHTIDEDIRTELLKTIGNLTLPRKDRGDEFIKHKVRIDYMRSWFYDRRLGGVCNHTARGHIPQDLHRYLYASCFASVKKRSPVLADFPQALHPNHRNVNEALNGSLFADRFRVQLAHRPSTTITSHISKDGHYYIHPDPTQCRSLTVRETARLQTFPDNYFFCGPRTAQYHQVGNAVPPLLAKQIAEIVWDVFKQADKV